MPLLRRTALIRRKDPVDDAGEGIQLRPLRWLAPPIPRRHRERQHLRYRPRVNAKPTRRLTPTDPFNLNRVADLPIQLHELHPQPSAFTAESFLMLEFYSGAARPPGRFSEGFLLRRLHNGLSLPLFAPKMMHHRADTLDADLRVLGFAVPQPPVQTVNLRDNHRLRRRPGRIIRRQATGDLLEVLQPHTDMEPIQNGRLGDAGISPASARMR